MWSSTARRQARSAIVGGRCCAAASSGSSTSTITCCRSSRRSRDAAANVNGLSRSQPGSGPPICWQWSSSRSAATTVQAGFREASSSAWRSRVRWPCAPGAVGGQPTGNLDASTADVVFRQLLALVRETGMAALVATHIPDLAARMDPRYAERWCVVDLTVHRFQRDDEPCPSLISFTSKSDPPIRSRKGRPGRCRRGARQGASHAGRCRHRPQQSLRRPGVCAVRVKGRDPADHGLDLGLRREEGGASRRPASCQSVDWLTLLVQTSRAISI